MKQPYKLLTFKKRNLQQITMVRLSKYTEMTISCTFAKTKKSAKNTAANIRKLHTRYKDRGKRERKREKEREREIGRERYI